MWKASHTETVAATAAAIWMHWTDVARWPLQDDGLESASINGPFEVGSLITMKPKGSPTVAVKLVKVTPNQSFASVGGLPLTTLRFEHLLEPGDDGTIQFTQSVTMDGPLAWLFSRLMGPMMARGLEKRMRKLAATVATRG